MTEYKGYLEDDQTKDDHIQAFVDAYGDTVCKALNVFRSDAQAGLKREYERRCTTGKPVPNPAQLARVIMRKGLEFDDEDPNKNETERQWFLWYWQFLLPKICGKNRWGQSIRNFGTISGHSVPGKAERKYVTPSDEALVLLLFENCGQRFPYTAKCLKNHTKPDKNAEQYQSKWTNAKIGQVKWGGWSLEGRKRFLTIQQKVSKVRRKNRTAEVETWALREIRRLNKLGVKPNGGDSGRIAQDFEGRDAELSNFLCVSDGESVDPEADDSDLEEVTEEYQSVQVPKKARAT